MSKRQYLTKSLFRMGIECPTKLFYTKKPTEYADTKTDDDFLRALARGGFQVGALARCAYPEGHLISTLDYNEALAKTDELLKQENVTIFEAAFKFENLFIRVDILKKTGDACELIEVKSSSANPGDFDSELWDKRKREKTPPIMALKKDWFMECYDVAFQTHVCRKAKPALKFTPFLMCADKSKRTSVDGLNQRFFVVSSKEGYKVTLKGDVTPAALGEPILCKLPMSEVVDVILKDREASEKLVSLPFEKQIDTFASSFIENKKIPMKMGGHCKGCEFRTEDAGKKSGFEECLAAEGKLKGDELKAPLVFDIWNFRKTDDVVAKNIYLVKDVDESDVKPKKPSAPSKTGLQTWERQLLQVKKCKENDPSEYIDEELTREIKSWKYPLHFIDFETCMTAIPFKKDQKPYEQTAFQFSHHIVDSKGNITHEGEWIEVTPGKFPNFNFVRELKAQLEKDDGTIFRYAAHENTVLCQIYDQLEKSSEPDKKELMKWITTVTTKKSESETLWDGKRTMVDLLEMVKRFYFHPDTGGSNSIKAVLPAILNGSEYLKARYSKPIYGLHGEISSRNYENTAWVTFDEHGHVKDPYKLLPKVFNDYDRATLDLIMAENEEIDDGGAAMTAYCYLQFSEMSDEERAKIKKALLKYCELDTLAMVMLWEHWTWKLNLIARDTKGKIAG